MSKSIYSINISECLLYVRYSSRDLGFIREENKIPAFLALIFVSWQHLCLLACHLSTHVKMNLFSLTLLLRLLILSPLSQGSFETQLHYCLFHWIHQTTLNIHVMSHLERWLYVPTFISFSHSTSYAIFHSTLLTLCYLFFLPKVVCSPHASQFVYNI